MFAQLTDSELSDHPPTLTPTKRREVVYLPDDPGETIYFVHTGKVRISRLTRDGKSLTLYQAEEGNFFGDSSLLGAPSRTEIAEVTEAGLLVEWQYDVFAALVAKSSKLSSEFTRQTILRRTVLENRLETLVFRDVNSKLAELLLDLASDHGVKNEKGTLLALKITHQELANQIGSTRETVSLTLAQFKKQDLVSTEGRRVIIADEERLRALM